MTVQQLYLSWHRNGSVYLGHALHNQKNGIGLEWFPGSYVYYGHYKDNQKHGYGIIKYNSRKAYVGAWACDQYHGYGKLMSAEGEILESGTYRNSQLKSSESFNELN